MPAGCDGFKRGSGGLLLPEANRFRAESAQDERGFHGLEDHFAVGERSRDAWRSGLAAAGDAEPPARACGEIRSGQIAHLDHLCDGGNAGDGFLGELPDAIRERAHQLAVDVDGAAAHAVNHAGVLGFGAMELGENEVLAGAARAAQHAQDFNLHGFRSVP